MASVPLEGAGHAHIDAVGGGVDRAAGDDGVLPGDAVENLLRRDAERGELGVAELDEDSLPGCAADDVDLVDVRHPQQALANVFGALLQLRRRQAVGRHHIERGIDVAVLVVEARADDALRQLAADVADLLADSRTRGP